MPRDLAETQGFLANAVKGRTPIGDDPALAEAAPRFVKGNAKLRPADQVEIYREQFWLRHRGLLRDDLQGLHHLLGDDAMDALCRDYLDAHPPDVYALRFLSKEVPRFLERWPGLSEDPKRALALEMARYERVLIEHRTAADVAPLDPGKLAGLPADAWERARIVLHPLLVRLELVYPVHRLRKAWVMGEAMEARPAEAPIHLALYRNKDLVTHFQELEREAYALLGLLGEGVPLVPALGRVAEPLSEARRGEVVSSVGRWFQQWTAWGIVADIALD